MDPFRLLANDLTKVDEDDDAVSKRTTISGASKNTLLNVLIVGLAIAACLSLIIIVFVIRRRKRGHGDVGSFDRIPSSLTKISSQTMPVRYVETAIQQTEEPLVENYGEHAKFDKLIKPKLRRLLERRGSNTSLTLDLGSMDSFDSAVPVTENSPMERLKIASRSISRQQISQFLKNMPPLQEEFASMPLGHAAKLDIPGSSNKNRYKSIWPNDQTRLILESDGSESTYINANFIAGHEGNAKAYIATQGPLQNTIDDFWRAVWQESCPVIVMMTKIKEKNQVKCEPYLPSKSEQIYGQIRVTVLKTLSKRGYSIRHILLEKNHRRHYLKHYWFTSWPDHKAPTFLASQLIDLIEDAEAERQNNGETESGRKAPILVHCSAGLGRTGCFIAISIGMQQLRENNAVDVMGIVSRMRLDRGGLVQTLEQYEFIYYTLALYERDKLSSSAKR